MSVSAVSTIGVVMTAANEIQEQQRQTWDRFSGGWTKWDQMVLTWLKPAGEEIIGSLDLREDGEHLDIASGTGEPGLSIAALVPRGRVVLTDVSSGMLAAASANAAARGLVNVEVRECGVDPLPFADASFDTISCRFGFMFFPDVAGSVAEMVRVLRPGGRLASAVWAEPAGNPWATIPMAAINAEVALPTPAPDAPGLFRCAATDTIAGIFRDAGLHNIVQTEVRGTLDAPSAEDYWTFMTEIAAPVVGGLGLADETSRTRIKDRTLEQIRPFETDGTPRIPFHARCITGTR
jgi:ubiquinone/menaquinone biosynthesis C-methylase UbiE